MNIFRILCLVPLGMYLAGIAFAAPQDAGQAVEAGEEASEESKGLFGDTDFNEGETEITSDSLMLKAEEQLFVYSGNVQVKQGDLTITAERLEGRYDDNNKIDTLVAKKNVVIIKGERIRANSEKAIYRSQDETVELTENPSIDQDGSVLTADLIRIFLKEDRSEAEGTVRVKMVKSAQS